MCICIVKGFDFDLLGSYVVGSEAGDVIGIWDGV